MGRAYRDNEGVVHIEDDAETARGMSSMPEPKLCNIVTECADDPEDDPIDGRGALVAGVVGVLVALAGVFAWVVWWKP